MTNTAAEAIAAARTQSTNGPKFGIGWCLKQVRICYDVGPHDYIPTDDEGPDAAQAWRFATFKHPTTNPASIPRGVPVFWTGGSALDGHIAISAGDGMCWSTDIRRGGYFDKVPIAEISQTWPRLTLAGWTEDLNNVRVHGTGPQPPKEPTMAARIDGVDLSHWQSGSLDFGKAKAAGVRWIYHKATEGWGARGAVDSAYNTRRVEVHKAGLPFGAYHFARPRLSNGRAQATFFLATAKPHVGDMRPMLDLEDAGGLGRAALTRWVGDFVAEVVAQTGVPPMLYTNFDLDKTFDCPLWVARYSNAMSAPKIPAPWKTYSIWQFSNGQFGVPHTVPGLGAVDINTMNGNPAVLTKAFTLAAAKKPTPTTPTEPDMPLTQDEIDRIAKAVAQLPVVNKDETGKEVSKGTLLGMLSRLDQNVDKLLAAQETTDPGNPPAAS